MLEWLTAAIEANAGRDKEMVQYVDYREARLMFIDALQNKSSSTYYITIMK